MYKDSDIAVRGPVGWRHGDDGNSNGDGDDEEPPGLNKSGGKIPVSHTRKGRRIVFGRGGFRDGIGDALVQNVPKQQTLIDRKSVV